MFEFLSKLFRKNSKTVEKTKAQSKEIPEEHICIDKCAVCGFQGKFYNSNSSFREGYQCQECKSSLRYRGQALSLLNIYGKSSHLSISDLSKDQGFSQLSIYEPGVIGPFRKLFSDYKNYVNSFYWNDVELGEYRNGIQCQSLEALTFGDDEIDLVISSDIMEHVRKPWDAFTDIYRVLKPGGYHIFSIPLHIPMISKTKYRVDTSSKDDIHIQEPHYHGDGVGGKSLVYTDFGSDIEQFLINIGYKVTLDISEQKYEKGRRLVTFVSKKPL